MIKIGDTVFVDGEIREATEYDVEFFNELERISEVANQQEKTQEARLSALEATTDDIILLMADLIGGN